MTKLARLLRWILKAAVFFFLFAFALNNQQDATVHLVFGYRWRAPMTLIVLVAFGLGMVIGVLGMLPSWWARHRRDAQADAVPSRPNATSDATAPHGV